MIVDSLKNAHLYECLHPSFKQAFDFLRSTDFSTIDDGRIELQGDTIYINLASNTGKKSAPLEAHRLYIDIQMPLSTTELIGWKSVSRCNNISEVYDNEKDILFYADDFDTVLSVSPGEFVIFFPQDAHAPAMGSGLLRKLVVKIKL
ncbi:MAG TPA: YhcH/YjgK/YiaL family protein [Paludibacteraceae bacterium]|mgnify:CR=1 FL=1|jgi:YhcH/YjgK/YiaL family protein|nr:YhcH/YjgK/YiaL family protein [Paludibacteraceae bacterium]HQB69086.1 YhcH/YjgK/YiaL family protein [Paludibacteraceae bacterium]HRS67552.1 YhcH/YjgK/YiaL family protein [Paludibacteraceae bacterium]